ncbi:hypothetical protein GF359_00710 [candidate division WOR-3 bacterium]|uniref:N-acetyltransferase domain-containing protein n=1 Tax=candidate division WOR-3 bacterium TaxID=2052148 RepID=A0A9D5K7Y7_UNCW3|nr:hypothetical protein [candidate division WOR-3 bacterium]MBD3363714.1 hypothetical protein [candidate division WOR-3 bacterium]
MKKKAEIREVSSKKGKKAFIYLPERMYEKKYPQWVHPIYRSQRDYFNPGKNDAWGYSDVILFLAWAGDDPVGRIMGIVNHRFNEFHKTREARFSYFDCIDDQETATRLLSTVEGWAKDRGADYIIGPLGFKNTDTQGVLVEGQEHRSIIASWWHPPYTPGLIEGAGYRKEMDWFGYKIELTDNTIPPIYDKITRRLLSRTRYRLLEFSSKREMKPYILPVFRLINESYTELYGFSPLTDREIRKTVQNYQSFLDPRFAKVVVYDNEVVAFGLGLPDLSPGFRAARGRLFPFGFLKILRCLKASRRLDLVLGAIKKKHRGKGLDVLMAKAMYTSAIQAGMTHMDTHKEQETNKKIIAEIERVGGRRYKRYRIYRKAL